MKAELIKIGVLSNRAGIDDSGAIIIVLSFGRGRPPEN